MQETLSQYATIETLFLIVSGMAILSILLGVWVLLLSFRLGRIFKGKHMHTLEPVLQELMVRSKDSETFRDATLQELAKIDRRIKRTVLAPDVARFDAFTGTGEGGRQSFATAFVSEQGNGMVLSSLYTRDRMRVYAKPVAEFDSTYELTEEERHALTKAKKHGQAH